MITEQEIKVGICADIDTLVEVYESQMNREKAQLILAKWEEKPKADYVDQEWLGDEEIKLDGSFTADELEAFVWCKRNGVDILDLARGL